MDARLREGLEAQLQRLMEQLDDLDSLRSGPLSSLLLGGNAGEGEGELALMEAETREQMGAFSAQLERMTREDVKLEDELGAMKAAVRAAIADAFKTPEVIRMFALQQPERLRDRLAATRRDMKLDAGGRKGEAADARRARQEREVLEILMALRRLGETLRPEEADFLRTHRTKKMVDFEQVEEDAEGEGDGEGGAFDSLAMTDSLSLSIL